MKRSAVIRLSLATILPVAIATACSDNGSSVVSPRDDRSLGAANGGAGSGTNTQGSPAVADTFSLVVHVITRQPGSDTLHGTPVAGATATLTKTEWTFIHGNGGDTMSGKTVTVGSKTTDANGNAQFDQLSADLYRVLVTRPGSNSPDSTASTIQLINVAKAVVPVVLR